MSDHLLPSSKNRSIPWQPATLSSSQVPAKQAQKDLKMRTIMLVTKQRGEDKGSWEEEVG